MLDAPGEWIPSNHRGRLRPPHGAGERAAASGIRRVLHSLRSARAGRWRRCERAVVAFDEGAADHRGDAESGERRPRAQGVEVRGVTQVGTDTRTASEKFFGQVLVDLPAPASRAGGHATVTIPADSMHSFESGHNKLTWQLTLEGEIRRWPDLKETYPLVVLPRHADDHKPEEL